MKRRQWRWILACVAAATGFGLVAAGPLVNAVTAEANPSNPPPSLMLTPIQAPSPGAHGGTSFEYSGYFENQVGALTLAATFTVPIVKCTAKSTGTEVGILALMNTADPAGGKDQHGGGVEVGCSTPTDVAFYTSAVCNGPSSAGCSAGDPVLPGDVMKVTVAASGGCSATCSSVAVTVQDVTEGWSHSPTPLSSSSNFDTFVAVVGSSPLVNFGKVTFTDVTINGVGSGGKKSNLVDLEGRALAKASGLTKGRTTFSVKWVRAS